MTIGSHACALDGCPNEIDPDFDEDDGYWSNPPEGWFAVYVIAHDKPRIELEFCSEEHLAERMRLPLPFPSLPSEEPRGSWISTAGLGLVLLSILTVFVIGLISSIRLVAGLA